ncbi:MAG TPA: hypothetical protein VG826_09775 [Pirellulales bacterium]|nr:hypothetical protein [Pirellulales bacterium]
MRLGFLMLIATFIPAVTAGAEPAPVPHKASPPAQTTNAALLEKKLADLKALQAEIRELRKAVDDKPQLLIEVQMLEVSPKRLEKAESNPGPATPKAVGGIQELAHSPDRDRQQIEAGMVLDRDRLRQRLKEWGEKANVKVLAEPKMVTVSGRPAQFQVGGMIPILDKAKHCTYQEYGTRVDMVATADEDGSVRLELRARQSWCDNNDELVIEGQKLPRLSVREIDTAARLLPAQVLVVGTFAGDRPDAERSPETPAPNEAEESGGKVAFIVLVQVEAVDGLSPVESGESDKEVYRKGFGQSETKVPSATAPQGRRR